MISIKCKFSSIDIISSGNYLIIELTSSSKLRSDITDEIMFSKVALTFE